MINNHLSFEIYCPVSCVDWLVDFFSLLLLILSLLFLFCPKHTYSILWFSQGKCSGQDEIQDIILSFMILIYYLLIIFQPRQNQQQNSLAHVLQNTPHPVPTITCANTTASAPRMKSAANTLVDFWLVQRVRRHASV